MTTSPTPRRVISAPGKLVLMGEYAVLLGHPAVVAAVDRRALCTLEPVGPDAPSPMLVSGASGDPFAPDVRDGHHRFIDDRRDELALLRHVLDAARARPPPLTFPQGHYDVSTSAFLDDQRGLKLGLGSSAAACVAFAAQLITPLHAAVDVAAVHAVAQRAHAAFSGDKGSGVDVAASSYGGVLRYVKGAAPTPWSLPPGLDVVVAFAGTSTSTRDFVARFEACADPRALVAPIAAATSRFLEATTAAAALSAVHVAREAMRALGEAAGIDVVSAPHRVIADVTARAGGAAKPSGAGGGDVAVCFVPTAVREALEDALRGAGVPVVALQVGDPGVRIE